MDILVVDDEKLARERLVRMIQKCEGNHVIGEANTGREALQKINQLKPDVVLLDIRMPDMDGLEAAQHIMHMDAPPAVIFCTAYSEHALEAFNAQAVGYLLKPVKPEQLEQALNNAQKLTKVQMSSLKAVVPAAGQKTFRGRKHISAKTRLGLELVPVDDVRCFQADHKYVTAYHVNGEILLDDTLKDLEDEFGDRFVRVHRNSLVSLDHVEGMDKLSEGQFALRLQGIALKPVISRRHVTELRARLRQL
jgi:two-component system, LytTR family, response regulator AlgR